jgi:hypothetical protein
MSQYKMFWKHFLLLLKQFQTSSKQVPNEPPEGAFENHSSATQLFQSLPELSNTYSSMITKGNSDRFFVNHIDAHSTKDYMLLEKGIIVPSPAKSSERVL